MSSLKVFVALCLLVSLLCGEVAARQPDTPSPVQCAEDPQTGAWIMSTFLRLPEAEDDELVSRSVLWLTREVDGKYTGSGSGVLVSSVLDSEPGWRFSYDFLGFYDKSRSVMSASLVNCETDVLDCMLWAFDCETLAGPGSSALNGTLSPFPYRQELTFLG